MLGAEAFPFLLDAVRECAANRGSDSTQPIEDATALWGTGRIFNLASIGGYGSSNRGGVYSASKFGGRLHRSSRRRGRRIRDQRDRRRARLLPHRLPRSVLGQVWR
jgi:NAD(P)-dependent dehydrogenase (short-subunit alcohol dehydrogenase family)